MAFKDWLRKQMGASVAQQANPLSQVGRGDDPEAGEELDQENYGTFGSTLPGLARGEQAMATRPVGPSGGYVEDIAAVTPEGEARTAIGAGDPQALRGAFNRLMMQEGVKRGVPHPAAPPAAPPQAVPTEMVGMEMAGAGGPGGPGGEGTAELSATWPEQGTIDYNSAAEREAADALRAGSFPYAGLATGRVRNVDVSRAARALGMGRADFVRKVKEAGVHKPAFGQAFGEAVAKNREVLRGQVPDEQLEQAALMAAESEIRERDRARQEAAEESRFQRQQALSRELETGRATRATGTLSIQERRLRLDEEIKRARLEGDEDKAEALQQYRDRVLGIREKGAELAGKREERMTEEGKKRYETTQEKLKRQEEEKKTKAGEKAKKEAKTAEKEAKAEEEKKTKSKRESKDREIGLLRDLRAAMREYEEAKSDPEQEAAQARFNAIMEALEEEFPGTVGDVKLGEE